MDFSSSSNNALQDFSDEEQFDPQDILHFIPIKQAKDILCSGIMQYIDKYVLPEEPKTACEIIT